MADSCDTTRWSEKVEDLISEEKYDEAASLLKDVISELKMRKDGFGGDLQLAAAMESLAEVYKKSKSNVKASEDLSMAALSLRACSSTESSR